MTHEHLTRLQRANAFNPTPRHDDLYALHVPFDKLANPATCETALTGLGLAPRRILCLLL